MIRHELDVRSLSLRLTAATKPACRIAFVHVPECGSTSTIHAFTRHYRLNRTQKKRPHATRAAVQPSPDHEAQFHGVCRPHLEIGDQAVAGSRC